MLNKLNIFLVALLFFPNFLLAQRTDTLSLKLENKKLPFGISTKVISFAPKTALVLSGGGARAISQIGVLKALKENNIRFDGIVGTSMGSIIGGLYSAGYCISDLDSLVKNTPWNTFFSFQKNDRNELFIDQKITEDKAIFALRLNNFTPVIPTYINTGQSVSNFLTLAALNAPIHTDSNFDDLLYRFRAVSTNLVNGQPEILGDGSLSLAMRASSSISFLLPPVKTDSLLLVDGGLVANLPVKFAKDLGFNYTIAVNTTSPLRNKSSLKYPWEIADQVVSIPIEIITKQQIKSTNILIEPEIGRKKNSDFNNLSQIIEKGYTETLKHINTIKAQLKEKFKSIQPGKTVFYKNLKLSEHPTETERKVYYKLLTQDSVSNKDILYELYKLYNSGDYKNILAKIKVDSGKTILKIDEEMNPVVRKINLSGNSIVDSGSIASIINPLLNKPYNPQKLLNKLLEILRLYRTKGYSLAQIDSVKLVNQGSEINIFISEGIISEIKVAGNVKTSKTVILREFPIHKGNYFKIDKLSEGLKSLTSTGLFDNVGLKLSRRDNKNILTIQVGEKISTVLRFGLRIDNENFTQASVDLRDENLFGTGTELGATFAGGLRNRSYSIEHLAHRIFNTYLTYKLSGYYKFNDVNVYKDDDQHSERKISRSEIGEYRQIFYGASIGVGTQVKKFGNIIVEGKYQTDEIKNKVFYPGFLPYQLNIASLTFKLSIDSQNKYPFPTKGVLLNTYYQTAQTSFGGDIGFTKFYAHYKNYFTFNKNHTISFGGTLGFADRTLPLSEQFSLGGQNSFFGYRDYEYRGRQILNALIEYRYHLPVKLFFDSYFTFTYNIGSIWAEQEQIRFKDLKHGIGATLSFDTPVGPANFSVGKSFFFKNTLAKNIIVRGPFYFYFTIGYYY